MHSFKQQPNFPAIDNNTVQINKPPTYNSSYYPSLALEIFLYAYYILLILVDCRSSNTRVVIYACLFMTDELVKNLFKMQDNVDPLNLSPLKKTLLFLSVLIKVDMFYLLIRLTYLHFSFMTVIMLVHFLIGLKSSKLSNHYHENDRKMSPSRIIEIFDPFIIYVFVKSLELDMNEISVMFLKFFIINLLLTAELKQILQCNYSNLFDWISTTGLVGSQIKSNWNFQQGFRVVVMVCCIMLVLQNFLLIFEEIKDEICLAILHTLILTATAQCVYITKR